MANVAAHEHLMAEASALPNSNLQINIPISTFLAEAVDVGRFARKYWVKEVDAAGKVLRPGLQSAGRKCTPVTVDELLTLVELSQKAQTAFLLAVDPANQGNPMPEAQFILGEITAVLEYFLDDGVEDEKDAQLAKLKQTHRDETDTVDGMAAALYDFCGMAQPHREELAGLGDFDAGLIDRGLVVAKQLRDKPPAGPPLLTEDARRKLDARNRLMILLQQRVAAVRSAARLVFRNHPAIAREVHSTYERRRRAEARRAAKNKVAG